MCRLTLFLTLRADIQDTYPHALLVNLGELNITMNMAISLLVKGDTETVLVLIYDRQRR
jgi:hypothetical protein